MVLLEELAMLLPPMQWPPLWLLLSPTLLLMVWESAMALLVTALAMALLVTVLAMALLVMPLLTQSPMLLLRSTPTRSPPTSTSMQLLTTTLDPASTLPRLTTALLPGRATTLSTCLTVASSTSTTEPTMPKATSPRSPTTARLSSLTLLPPLLPMLSLVQLLPMPLLVQLLPLSLALLAPSATWAKYYQHIFGPMTSIFISIPNKSIHSKK